MGTKIIKSDADSDAGIVVGKNVVRATVDEKNGWNVDERGVTINGPVSFVSGTNHIRVGGLWTFNTPFQMTLPSTYATPTPTLVVDMPIKQLEDIMKSASLMIGLLSAVSSL